MASKKLAQQKIDEYERLDGGADLRLIEDLGDALGEFEKRARTPLAKAALFIARRALHGARVALMCKHSDNSSERFLSEHTAKFLFESSESFYALDNARGKERQIFHAIRMLDTAIYDGRNPEESAAAIVDEESRLRTDENRIGASVAAWTKAITDWRGKVENPRGGSSVGGKPYFWYEVVYVLLNEGEKGDIRKKARDFVKGI